MPEEGCETAETDLHVLWHGGLQRMLQNCRASFCRLDAGKKEKPIEDLGSNKILTIGKDF